MDAQDSSVINKRAFELLHPDRSFHSSPVLTARHCTMCGAKLISPHPIERLDQGLWCSLCQDHLDALATPRKPGFLYGEDEEWYDYYRFCPQCGSALLSSPHHRGETIGDKTLCRTCYPKKQSWEKGRERIDALRSRVIFNTFWMDCRNGNIQTMPMWAKIYGFILHDKIFKTKQGTPFTVTGLVLPPITVLGIFYPHRDHPTEPFRFGWWSPLDKEEESEPGLHS